MCENCGSTNIDMVKGLCLNCGAGLKDGIKRVVKIPRVCESCGSINIDMVKGLCLNCGAGLKGRIKMQVLFAVAVVLILIGVSYMYIVSTTSIATVEIRYLDDNYDNRYVTISGTITNVNFNTRKYEKFGRFGFEVYDGTGIVYVSMDEDVSEGLYKKGKIPMVGFRVMVGGIFYGQRGVEEEWYGRKIYRPDGVIKVNSPQRIEFLKTEYESIAPVNIINANITVFDPGQCLVLNGTIENIYNTSTGIILKLLSGGEVLSIIMPHYIFTLGLYDYEDIYVGAIVEIKGALEWYQSRYGDKYSYWEVSMHKITVKGNVQYGRHSLTTLLANKAYYNGALVNTTGIVDYIYWYEGDNRKYTYRFKLRPLEGGDETVLIYIEDRSKNLYEGDITVGSTVEVHGVFQNYTYSSGDVIWEIKIRDRSTDVVIVISTGIGGQLPTEEYEDIPLSNIVTQPWIYEGTLVNTTGIVDYIYWDSDNQGYYTKKFKIRPYDMDENIVVYIEDRNMAITEIYKGSKVNVRGQVYNYTYSGGYYWEIKVRANTGDGITIVELQPTEEYTDVAFDTLVEDKETYNNTLVHVSDVVIVDIEWSISAYGNYTKRFHIAPTLEANLTLLVYIEDESKYLYNISVGTSVEIYGMFQMYIEGDYMVWEILIRAYTTDQVAINNGGK